MTLYSHPDVRLVPNPIGVYSIGYRTELVLRRGRRVAVHIAAKQPDGHAVIELGLPSTTAEEKPVEHRAAPVLPRRRPRGQWSPPAMTIEA